MGAVRECESSQAPLAAIAAAAAAADCTKRLRDRWHDIGKTLYS